MNASKNLDQSSFNNDPLITVIIPTFRRPHLLKRAIDSVLAQTYRNFQICIYDNDSKDETSQVVAEYAVRDKRIKYHVHQENIGSNNNWQYGFNKVNTPFFVVLSDDDLFMPMFLEEAIKGFEQYPDAGMFIGGLIIIDEKHRVKWYDLYEWADRQYYKPKEFIAELVRGRPFPFWAAMVFRKEVRDRTGQLKGHLLWHDVDFLMRALKEFSVILSSTPCSIFFIHDSNISLKMTINDLMQLRSNYYIMLEDLFSPEEKELLGNKLREETPKHVVSLALQKFARRSFKECLSCIEILIEYNALKFRVKIFKFCCQICLKISWFFYLLIPLMYIRKAMLRIAHHVSLKKMISDKDYKNFRNLIKR